MNPILKYSGVVALVILAILGISGSMKSTSFGTAAACATDVTCFTKLAALTSLQSDGTAIFNGAATFSSGATLTTTNTATSTLSVGCIQTVATSTATPIRLVFSRIATSSPTFSGSGQNTRGLVGWQFGTCPH